MFRLSFFLIDNYLSMRLIIILVFISICSIQAQPTYFVEYTDLTGVNIYDIHVEQDTLLALTGYIGSDPVAIESGGIKIIKATSGQILNGTNISDLNNSIPFYLKSAENVIYILYFDHSNVSNTKLVIKSFESQNLTYSDSISIPFYGNLYSASWNITKDSIAVLGYTNASPQGVRFATFPVNNFPETVETKLVTKLGPPHHMLKISEYSNDYLVFCFNGLHFFNSDSGESYRADQVDVAIHGKSVTSIEGTHYITFGRAIEITDLRIVKYDTALNMVKEVTFGMGENSYDYPAITSCIDNDSQHYFVAAVINSSFNPYTNTTPKSYYVGKYDADLESEWLHVFGGDRHFFISGVKADFEGGCYVYGFTRSAANNLQATPFLMRLNADGVLTSTWDPGSTDFSLTIFGNPGSDAFRFHFNAADASCKMVIHDMQGRLHSEIPVAIGYNEILTSFWPAGTYFYQLLQSSGTILERGKWVKIQ